MAFRSSGPTTTMGVVSGCSELQDGGQSPKTWFQDQTKQWPEKEAAVHAFLLFVSSLFLSFSLSFSLCLSLSLAGFGCS
jgi:hypothetical protein